MSATAFEVEGIAYTLGEYIITESTYNGRVVYYNRVGGYFFYSIVDTFGIKYWALGGKVGSENLYLYNRYCSNLDNLANGNCKYGWFYYHYVSSSWKYDINMRIQCTNYVPNSIT